MIQVLIGSIEPEGYARGRFGHFDSRWTFIESFANVKVYSLKSSTLGLAGTIRGSDQKMTWGQSMIIVVISETGAIGLAAIEKRRHLLKS